MNRIIPLGASVCGFAISALCQLPVGDWAKHNLPAAGPGRLRAVLEEGVENKSIPGGSLLVVHKGEVVFRQAVGWADIESKRSFTVDDACWIASITKPYTATLLMMLAAQGKLSLDAPIDKYLPAFAAVQVRGQGPARARPNLRQLLSHTGGFPAGPQGDFGTLLRSAVTLKETVDGLAKLGLIYEPGERHLYTSVGYLVAGRVAEVVTGEEFAALMNKMLLEPIGTPRATFHPDAELRRRIPVLYARAEGGFRKYELPANTSAFARPGGGLYATLDDVAAFFLLHQNRGAVNGKTLVPPRMLEEMYVAQPKTPAEGYGLGFNTMRRGPDGRARRIRHLGASGTLAFLDFDAGVITVLFTQVPGNQDMRFRERVAREVSSLFIE